MTLEHAKDTLTEYIDTSEQIIKEQAKQIKLLKEYIKLLEGK